MSQNENVCTCICHNWSLEPTSSVSKSRYNVKWCYQHTPASHCGIGRSVVTQTRNTMY